MFAAAGDPTLPPPPQLPPQQHPGILPIMEMDGRWKAHIQQAPNCPRCASTHTKFCYYNNYSLAQPRYFCKGCRRYWTKGGSLRNVPVGGGCRKSRRSRSKHHLPTTTSTHKPGGGPDPSNPHSTSSSPEIDMAAVFANYLNQDQSASQPQCFESSSPIQQLASHNTAIEQQEANTTIPRLESFNHGPLLHAEDVFWSASEDGSSLSSGLAPNWEPMAAQQELDSSPLALYSAAVLDDQFSVSANSLLSDINWSCFDLPGYGDFCTSA